MLTVTLSSILKSDLNLTKFVKLLLLCTFALMSFSCCRFYVSSKDVIADRFQDREEKVAPLFIHGEGVGTTGCWEWAPPVFCKEKVARGLIISELKKAGIEIDYTNVRIDDITKIRRRDCCMLGLEKLTACDKWSLDGYCSELNIGFEFVSKQDYFCLGPEHPRYYGNYDYNFIFAAEELRKKFDDYGKISVAVFYDPVQPIDESIQRSDEDWSLVSGLINEFVALLIRAQVQDFIQWLKSEGYIEDGE